MYKIGTDHHALSSLNWRDIWDNLLWYARGINTINRDSLEIATVLRSMLELNTALQFKGFTEENFVQFVPEIGTGTLGEWNRYKIMRKQVKIDFNALGQYIFSYHIKIDRTDSENISPTEYPLVRLSVDGLEIPGGHDFAGMAFTQTSMENEVNKEDGGPLSLSGCAIALMLPGLHVVDLDFVANFNSDVVQMSVSAQLMAW